MVIWYAETVEEYRKEGASELIRSGFYAVNGASVYSAKESSKKDAVIEFLDEVRNKNAGKRIVMILDNFRAHTSQKTRDAAEALRIELVFLPPYSPDLNPIEFIWKSIKRALSALVLSCREEVKCVVEALFCEFAASLSFAAGWIETFLGPLGIKA